MSTNAAVVAPHRPFGVSLLSVLLYIGGVLNILAGVFSLFARGNNELLREMKATPNEITAYGIVAIVFGVLVMFIAHLLRRQSNFARLFVAVIAAIQLGLTIWAIVSYHAVHWYNAIAPLVIYALVAGYLFFDRDAKEYFGRA